MKFRVVHTDKLFFMLGIISVIVTIGIYPLMKKGVILGHDLGYQMLRIESLYQEVMNGNFFPKINNLINGGYGYASSLFYPDLFLYIPVALRMIGFTLQNAYKVFLIMIIIGTYISSYYSGFKILKNRNMANVVAVIYSLSSYHITNIYIRSALGEVIAQIFIPIVIYGVYNLIYEKKYNYYLFIIGFTGLIYSHTITFALCLCLLFISLFINYIKMTNKASRILKLIFTGFIVILITCY